MTERCLSFHPRRVGVGRRRCCIALVASPETETGRLPWGGLTLDADGNLYGTTAAGGIYYSNGTVFELAPQGDGSWKENVLHSFGRGTDGANPRSGLGLRRFRQSLRHNLQRRH